MIIISVKYIPTNKYKTKYLTEFPITVVVGIVPREKREVYDIMIKKKYKFSNIARLLHSIDKFENEYKTVFYFRLVRDRIVLSHFANRTSTIATPQQYNILLCIINNNNIVMSTVAVVPTRLNA